MSPSPTASLDSQLLLGHVLGRTRSWILAHADEPLTPDALSQYQQLIDRRALGVPVAYLRGYCEWFGMTLRVTPDVLVPRPETEVLVAESVTIARALDVRRVVDVGTGSGAIAIQLARSLPETGVFGVDLSREALEVARYNAELTRTSSRITWLEGHLLSPLPVEPNLIVANLPYLSESMMGEIGPDVRHEPRLALCGGVSGLEAYRELFQQRRDREWFAPVVLEIDPRQSAAMATMIRTEFSEPQIRVLQDYAGLDRVVVVGA